MDKRERMAELVNRLNEAAMNYYQMAAEIMTDMEYDRLYDELLELEKETGVVLPNSPTVRVGYEVLTSLKKVTHESRMLSLDKTKEVERLGAFLGEREGLLSWKLDGLTVVLTYRNGRLYRAVTRGNGVVGEDITHNAKTFTNIPKRIDFKGELVLRGEAVIKYKDFESINERLAPEEQYKNPRNLCSGTVRQLNSEVCAKRNVSCIIFTLVRAEGKEFKYKEEGIEFLRGLGFEFVEYIKVDGTSVGEGVAEFERRIEKNEFASDGLVLTYNDIEYSRSLGSTAKFPRDSIAFKWADELAETTITNIIWNTSRTGLINPIAVFEPVELEGTTVERASLHNLSIVEELKIGIGDRVKVYKANMIIPQIAENLTQSGNARPPERCLVCGEETEVVKLRDGKALKCPNPNCGAQIEESLSHFCSRDAFNIEGMSDKTIKKFVSKGFIRYYTDIFDLALHKDEIIDMEGFGERSFEKLTAAIEKSRDIKLPNLLFGLGIENVGLSNARLLCESFGYDIDKIRKADSDEFVTIDGFGEIIAKSIERYFSNEKNNGLLDRLLEIVRLEEPERNDGEKSFEGMSFVVTGNVEHFKNRKELAAVIEKRGGKVTGSVSSKTNYLINNDINSTSSKNKKAKELGVEIITEEMFLDML